MLVFIMRPAPASRGTSRNSGPARLPVNGTSREQTMMDNATVTAEHTVHPTRLGDLTIVRDGDALTGLYYPRHWYRPGQASFGRKNDRAFDDARRQLDEYLAGTRTTFDLPLAARGSELQRRVWELIAQVPYGQTATYGDLARWLGGGVTAQQAGAAVGRNPLSILIPCH